MYDDAKMGRELVEEKSVGLRPTVSVRGGKETHRVRESKKTLNG